ncbi:flavodoxin [Clostridium carnis]
MKIVFWSGTGNTEKMASIIAEGIVKGGKVADLVNVSDAALDIFDNEEIVVLGCPAMGAEVLEEAEFEPFIEGISSKISGKKVALFGSYGWGSGEWMKEWEDRMASYGCELIDSGLIINYEPEDESSECIDFGLKIAQVN